MVCTWYMHMVYAHGMHMVYAHGICTWYMHMVCTWYMHMVCTWYMHMVHGWWYGMACDVSALRPLCQDDLDGSWQILTGGCSGIPSSWPWPYCLQDALYQEEVRRAPFQAFFFSKCTLSVRLVRDRLNQVESGWYILNHFDRICKVGGIESLSRSSIGGMAPAMYLAGCCFRAWLLP